ncbi:MAG: SpoIIE family protein phosphatase [Planctomycetaceae bacterium]
MKPPSIKLSGPILFLIPVLIVAAALSLVAMWQVRRLAEKFAARVMDQAAARVEATVNGYLTNAVQATKQVDRLIAAGELDVDDLRPWRLPLHRQLLVNAEINSVTFGNRDGDATWMIRYPGETELEYAVTDDAAARTIVEYGVDAHGELGDVRSSYPFDPRVRPWYEAAVTAEAPTWSVPYAWVGGNHRQTTLGIAYAVPIRDDEGQIVGVLDSDISLKDVSRFLAQARVFESGEAVLVDADGKLIATSMNTAVVNDDGARIAAVDAGEPLIADVAKHVGSFASVSLPHEFVVRSGKQAFRVEVRPLQNPWDLPWRLAVIVPESEVMAGVAAMRLQASLISGIVVVITLGLGMLAAFSIVRPVTAVAAAVRKMAGGNLDDQVQVGGHREFVQLSHELNDMSAALKDRMRLRHSLSLAMEIQQKLLPSAPPVISGLDVAGRSTYCDETGGDYYDFIEVTKSDSEKLVVVLGDVMGHGIAAALLMATARGILRSRAGEEDSLGLWLRHVNRLLVEDTGGERFMTLALLVCDPVGRRIRLASAGHDQPLMYDPSQDAFIELPDVAGLPLGLVAEEEYEETRRDAIAPGSIVLVGTDGLWESENERGEPYGKDRICNVIRANAARSAQEISNAVTSGLRQFRGTARQEDDITFVLVKFT